MPLHVDTGAPAWCCLAKSFQAGSNAAGLWGLFAYSRCTLTVALLLAEMAHNVISPHNTEFFKLWDELWEVGTLLRSRPSPHSLLCIVLVHNPHT